MLKFRSTSQEDLQTELSNRSTEVSVEIINSICDALDENADQVFVGFIVNLNLALIINKKSYLESLKLNFSRVEEAEEYELCERAMNWIKKLENNEIH